MIPKWKKRMIIAIEVIHSKVGDDYVKVLQCKNGEQKRNNMVNWREPGRRCEG